MHDLVKGLCTVYFIPNPRFLLACPIFVRLLYSYACNSDIHAKCFPQVIQFSYSRCVYVLHSHTYWRQPSKHLFFQIWMLLHSYCWVVHVEILCFCFLIRFFCFQLHIDCFCFRQCSMLQHFFVDLIAFWSSVYSDFFRHAKPCSGGCMI